MTLTGAAPSFQPTDFIRQESAYVPHNGGQVDFHKHGHLLWRWLVCGRRWGKDRATIQEMWRACSKIAIRRVHNRARYRSLVPLVHVWVVAPDYPRLEQFWNEMKVFIPDICQVKVNEAKHRMECTVTGDREPQIFIELKSAVKPKSLTSVGLDVLVITEAGLVKKVAWDEALQPCLFSPGRVGMVIGNGTPKGPNWFKKEFDRAIHAMKKHGPKAGRWALQAGSYTNPHITPSRLREVLRNMSRRKQRQEVHAIFLGAGEAYFPDPGPRKWPDGKELVIALPVIISIDWGRTGDPTIFTALDLHGHMLATESIYRKGFDFQFKQLHKFAQQFIDAGVPPEYICFVPEVVSIGGHALAERIAKEFDVAGYHTPTMEAFVTTGTSKPTSLETLNFDLEEDNPEGLWLLDDPELINQLITFEEGDVRHTRHVKSEDEDGEVHHFDHVMALAMGNSKRHDFLEWGYEVGPSISDVSA